MIGELLGALGLAWPRLLLYPGGLFALGASWLLARWLAWCAGRAPAAPRPLTLSAVGAALPPLLAVTLLPLAPARGFPFGIDLVVAVGLLEWPRLLQAAGNGLDRIELMRAYAPVVVAALLLAEGAGGLGLSALLTWPAGWLERGLLAAGTLVWIGGLPRLLTAGPDGLAGRVRALGLLLVGALPLVGALGTAIGLWAIPAALLAAAASVGVALRLGRAALRN